jgi:2-amino-4-hydroxy-6-hydroxymethyldihydropteridine diphosphokinase
MRAEGIAMQAVSRTCETAPLGPSRRRYANAAVLIETADAPAALLARLKRIERSFGRRRAQRWAARVLDLDIILWSGGRFAGAALTIPHPAFRTRNFVLVPLRQIAPAWRDPLTGLSIRHLTIRSARPNRLTRPEARPSDAAWSGP